MNDLSIITGKINTAKVTASNSGSKRMYIKIFPGLFTMKAPRPKKAKILVGELLIRYSGREWPVKKNGSLVGDEGVLAGIAELLGELNLKNASDISWASEQRDLKDTVTVRVGPDLSAEIIARGWAYITD